MTLESVLSLFGDQSSDRICIIKSGVGRIYTGSINGFLSSISEIYKSKILGYEVEKVYNETDIGNEGKKTTFFIRIGGSK